MGSRESTAWFSALLAALCLVAVAGAGAASSPSTVATTFVKGFLGGDPAACGAATPRLQALIAKVGEQKTCRMTILRAGVGSSVSEKSARNELTSAAEAGHFVIEDRLAARGGKRYWTSARYTLSALAADLRSYGVHVRLGTGPVAARGVPDDVVVIDRRRSTRTTLVLYAESAAGTIWRLSSSTAKVGRPTATTTRGTRGVEISATAHPYPPTPSGSRVLVTVPDEEFGHVELLLGLTPTPLVDTILVGASVLPLRAGTGPADTREVAERIVGAWTRQEPAALCALYDPALAAAAALFDRDSGWSAARPTCVVSSSRRSRAGQPTGPPSSPCRSPSPARP